MEHFIIESSCESKEILVNPERASRIIGYFHKPQDKLVGTQIIK
jgi:hypothetical protein